MNNDDNELALLERVYEAQKEGGRLTQRDLAQSAGLSLGMTNALVKRLAERGWLSLTRLSAKTLRYALTPAGLSEVASRTAGYFSRATRNSSLYRDRLEGSILGAKRRGAEIVVLLGASELDFIIEYLCERHGLAFIKSADAERAPRLSQDPKAFLVWAESLDGAARGEGALSLRDVMIGSPKERP